MYRRYGDPSWDSPESADAGAQASAPAGPAHRRARRIEKSPAAARLPVVEIQGVDFHAITERQAIAHVLDELDAGRGGVVVTPNLDYTRRCNKDVQFAAMVAESDLIVPDGMPLIWASRLLGTPLPERVAGSNLISTLSGAAAERGRAIFLLGGAPGTAEGSAKVLRERFPGIKIVGTHCPPFGYEKNPRLLKEIDDAVIAARPDIVFVALGAPKQEKLVAHLETVLPTSWLVGVGNSFSFLCGHVQRAPKWMQRSGLEWVHRMFQEPGRLWKRYILAGVPFAGAMLAKAAVRGVPNRLGRRRRKHGPGPDAHGDAAVLPPGGPTTSPGTSGNGDGHGNGSAHAPAVNGNGNGAAHHAANGNGSGAVNDHGHAHVNGRANGHANGNGHVASAGIIPGEPASPDDSAVGLRLPPRPAGSSIDDVLSRLRALVLLGGSVRPSPLTVTTGRSVLDLPLDENGSLLNYWLSQGIEVARLAGLARLPVRVLVNHASAEPNSASEKYYGTFRVERDLSEYRGTGGVLKDVAADYADDDLILVANAAQVLLDPLPPITAALARQGGDVNLVAHEDGTPSGVSLLTCKTLRLIAAAGFVDMKEQALPQVAARYDVRVLRRRRPTGLPVRTLEDYVQAVRFYHRRRAGKPITADPLAEDFAPAFSLVEPGATVDGSVRVHDSVVLAGAVVEPGAVLVRSLVCPGAVVRRDRTVVDEMVMPTARDRKAARATAVAAR